MKVVYPTCCGIDVHKSFLVATVIKTEDITRKYSKKRFSMFNNYYKNKYERISKRRGKKCTITAIARMIITAIYQMFTGDKV